MSRPLDFESPLSLVRSLWDRIKAAGAKTMTDEEDDDDGDHIVIHLEVIDLDNFGPIFARLEVDPDDDHRIDDDGWLYVRAGDAPWIPIGNLAEDIDARDMDDEIRAWKRHARRR